jgi:hypothetical protein
LGAIVSADVAGYSRLMGADASGALAALEGHRHAMDPMCANRSRFVKIAPRRAADRISERCRGGTKCVGSSEHDGIAIGVRHQSENAR